MDQTLLSPSINGGMVCAKERPVSMEFSQKRSGIPRVIHVTTIGITSYRALLGQCRYFRENGMEVGFVFSPSPEGDMLRYLGYPVKEVYIDRKINPWADSVAILKLIRYFRDARPDIVHTHTSKAGVVGRVAAKLAGVSNIFHTVHGFFFHPGMSGVRNFFYQQIERRMAGFTDVMLSQSEEDVITADEKDIKPRRGGLVHIGNGVDLSEFDPGSSRSRGLKVRETLGMSSTDPVITLIGRVNREKGYHDLVEALHGVKDLPWQAFFIGPDEGFLIEVIQKIDELKLSERIRIMGQRKDIVDLLAATDIYVLPSYREGLPRSLIEAQAMAIPCLATDIRGCREVVEEGVSGYLFPPGDCEALGEALRKLLLDPGLRFRLGQNGRMRVKTHFDEAAVGRKILDLYREVISGKRMDGGMIFDPDSDEQRSQRQIF